MEHDGPLSLNPHLLMDFKNYGKITQGPRLSSYPRSVGARNGKQNDCPPGSEKLRNARQSEPAAKAIHTGQSLQRPQIQKNTASLRPEWRGRTNTSRRQTSDPTPFVNLTSFCKL